MRLACKQALQSFRWLHWWRGGFAAVYHAQWLAEADPGPYVARRATFSPSPCRSNAVCTMVDRCRCGGNEDDWVIRGYVGRSGSGTFSARLEERGLDVPIDGESCRGPGLVQTSGAPMKVLIREYRGSPDRWPTNCGRDQSMGIDRPGRTRPSDRGHSRNIRNGLRMFLDPSADSGSHGHSHAF